MFRSAPCNLIFHMLYLKVKENYPCRVRRIDMVFVEPTLLFRELNFTSP
jgi:hypothetical protein